MPVYAIFKKKSSKGKLFWNGAWFKKLKCKKLVVLKHNKYKFVLDAHCMN